jgi:hypothetical protein
MSNKIQRSFADAQQFLLDALASPSIAHGYYEIGQKIRGQLRPASLMEWLSARGYRTTPTHILHALEHLRDSHLSYWAGIYGETILEKPGGTAPGGPPLAIIDDKTILLDNVPISDFQFSNRNLAWGKGNSQSAGNLRFDELRTTDGPAQPAGSGFRKVFNGSLVQNQCEPGASALPYTGRIGPVTALPLDNWSGVYTAWTGSASARTRGPDLVVQDRNLVLLDGVPIRNLSYSSVGHMLSWGLDYNTTAGYLAFESRSDSTDQPGGFSGTIQAADDGPVLPYRGELSTPTSLSGWVGVYGQTMIEEVGGHHTNGPELVILADGQVILDGHSVRDPHYDADTQMLTWSGSANGTSGHITFRQGSASALHRQRGKCFQGTLQLSATGPLFSFSGIPGQPYSGGGGFQEEALLKACMDKSGAIGKISRITLPYRQNKDKTAHWGGTKTHWSGERIPAKRNTGKDIETY